MTPREWYDEARRLRALLARIEQMCYSAAARNERADSRIIGGPGVEAHSFGDRGRLLHGE